MPSITIEQLDTLVALQGIETGANEVKSKLQLRLDKGKGLEDELSEIENNLFLGETELETFRKQYRTLESDVKENQGNIAKSQEKLRSVKTNKEYQSMLKEIDEMKDQGSKIEDEMLTLLESIDEKEKSIVEIKAEYNQSKGDISNERAEIEKEAQVFRDELAEMTAEQKAIEGKIDPSIFRTFSLVKEKVHGSAAVPVVSGICKGCHMNIPTQLFNELMRRESFQMCPHCQRIIYCELQKKSVEAD